MPIYEFYCPDCNTIYSFFSRKVNTSKTPDCPKCGRKKLDRQISSFSQGGRHKGEGDESAAGLGDIDESKVERAVSELASQAESLDENDPKQAAGLMRKFSKMTGVEFGEGMQHALARLEAGESPDKVEEEMGSVMDGEDAFLLADKKGKNGKVARRNIPVRRDKNLYDL